MAFSETISNTTFNTNRVIDSALRRCRLPAQAITPEMQSYAKDSLYLILSSLVNVRPPSWCIQRQVYSMTQGQPAIELDAGTVNVLNLNLRTLQSIELPEPIQGVSDTIYEFTSPASASTIGVRGEGVAEVIDIQTSDDGVTWTSRATITTTTESGVWFWADIVPVVSSVLYRLVCTLAYTDVYFGTLPQEIPMGVLNRDGYVNQSNKTFEGRPLSYWFQKDVARPKINLWPAPNLAAEVQQAIVWRCRHPMDVGTLQQEIEVPQRWLECIVDRLASELALQTPSVDAQMIPLLEARSARSMEQAWAGDTDGSPMYIQPMIGAYTA